jgi:hypothetical protein
MEGIPIQRHWGWYTAGFYCGCVAAGVYLGYRRERHWREQGVGLRSPRQPPLFFLGKDRTTKEYLEQKGETGSGALTQGAPRSRPQR